MASYTTALEEFSDLGNSRTYVQTATHTASKPKLVIQKRRVPEGNSSNLESTVSVIHATEDPDGNVMSQKVLMQATIRYPKNGDSTDVTAALAIFRDLVASDEFTDTVNKQLWL